MAEAESQNPFIRYRWLLDSYRNAIGRGWSDADFVSLVTRLDKAVAEVDGAGFATTPFTQRRSVGRETAAARPGCRVNGVVSNSAPSTSATALS